MASTPLHGRKKIGPAPLWRMGDRGASRRAVADDKTVSKECQERFLTEPQKWSTVRRMLKPLGTIAVPVVARGFLFTRMIGTTFHHVLQCDKCQRVVVYEEPTAAPILMDAVVGCCEKCRVCGSGPHIPGGAAVPVTGFKNYTEFMHVFALERRTGRRDSAMQEDRRR